MPATTNTDWNDIAYSGFELAQALEAWFVSSKRDLPWRHTKDPYAIWLSEVILQQTRVAAALPYYERFLATLPTVEALAKADEPTVLKLWEGLGYYSRARNLQKGARYLLGHHGGKFPTDLKEILAVPGIGPYTAGAILSFAFGLAVPALDGNGVRVLSRLLCQPWLLSSAAHRKQASSFVEEKIFSVYDKPSIWNEGLIELGALICLPKNPHCESCPLASFCRARVAGKTAEYPLRPEKKENPVEAYAVLLPLLSDGRETLVEKRPDTGLLARLYQFPLVPGEWDAASLEAHLEERGWEILHLAPHGRRKHVFSHLTWELQYFKVRLARMPLGLYEAAEEETTGTLREAAAAKLQAVPLTALNSLPFGSAFHDARRLLLLDAGIPEI